MNKSLRESNRYSFKSNGILSLTVKDVDTRKRTIKAVGNTYNHLDSQLDVLQMGAAKNSIKLNGPGAPKDTAKIKHALFHDLTMLPGKITYLNEEDVNINGEKVQALVFESKLSDTQLGNDTLTNYLDGIYDNHSIGFKYMKVKAFDPKAHGNSVEGKEWAEFKQTIRNADEYEELAKSNWDSRVLRVDEIKLFEISTVPFGANPLTPYMTNKSITPDILRLHYNNRLKKLNETIKKGTQSDDMMFVIKAQIDQLESIHEQLFDDEGIQKYISERFGVKTEQEETKNEENTNDDKAFQDKLKNFKL